MSELLFDKKVFDKQIIFNSPCVRKKSNFSKPSYLNLIDSKHVDENKEYFKENITNISPKIIGLFHTIDKLDKEDFQKHGKMFKHFIFTDIRSSLYGAKIIGSAFIDKGYHLGYTAERTGDKNKATFKKITLLSENELDKTKNDNFYILCSSGLFDQPINRELKKNILQNFNERPNNIYGKNIRFIIMDSGYKEGIDLFDIKYIHIFEPQTTMADLKQVIGRGTRLCGQKGLNFHPKLGWELNVYIYDLNIGKNIQPLFLNSKSAFELYLKSLNYDVSLYNFQANLEETVIEGAVDYPLNKNINKYIPEDTYEITVKIPEYSGGGKKYIVDDVSDTETEGDVEFNDTITENSEKKMNYKQMKKYISKYFRRFTWDKIKVENNCVDKVVAKTSTPKSPDFDMGDIYEDPVNIIEGTNILKGGNINPVLVNYTKTQDFIRHFFTPQLHNRGILLWHSVGTGKTCTAIATATSTFEPQGYTILWVTRTTLVNDIWKNMFSQVCNENLRKRIQTEDLEIPDNLNKQVKLLSKSWRIHPLSYKQFTNLVSKKNQYYKTLEKINGSADPLRKTLIIIDEAHKLYGESDLLTNEKPNMEQLHASLMNSYAVSGKQSVKLMLMTATPITKNPMELIMLINLCKPLNEQLPTNFYSFKEEYLDQDGLFTQNKKQKFLNDMAGYVSYLDRSSDVRQFAQPKLHYINTNLITDESLVMNDKRGVRALINLNLNSSENKERKQQIRKEYETSKLQIKKLKKEFNKGIEAEFKQKLEHFKTKKIKSKANKTIKKYIKDSSKQIVEDLKEKLAEYKTALKQKIAKFGDDIEANEDLKDPKFKLNVYYNLKYRCGKSINNAELTSFLNSYPEMIQIENKIKALEGDISKAETNAKENIMIHKNTMKNSKKDKDIIKVHKQNIKEIAEKTKYTVLELKQNLAEETLKRKKTINKLKKNIRITIQNNVKTRKRELKEALERDKNKVIEYNEDTKKLLLQKKEELEKDIDKELKILLKEEDNVTLEKEQKRLEKESEKERKLSEKAAEKERKLLEKEKKLSEKAAEKERKLSEKAAEKERKLSEKAAEKERKRSEKEHLKANKTKKGGRGHKVGGRKTRKHR
jgi:hypothetical protein